MKISLKDLKENKGQKKEFKFLVPVADLLKKEYKKLLNDFDGELFGEALQELVNTADNKQMLFATYESPEKLIFRYMSHFPIRGVKKIDKEKGWSLENAKVNISDVTADPERVYERKGDIWGRNVDVPLSELYVITDKKAFEEFVFDVMIKREEKRIKELKQEKAKQRDTLKEKAALREKYGVNINDYNVFNRVKLLEALETGTPNDKYKALDKIMDDIYEDMDERCDRW